MYADETSADVLEAWREGRRDADLEMAQTRRVANLIAKVRATGRCPRISVVGYNRTPFYAQQRGLRLGERAAPTATIRRGLS